MKQSYSRFGLIYRMACVVLVCSLLTHAQQNAKRDAKMKSARLDAFITNASAAIPEVAADLLIKVAESNLISDRQKESNFLKRRFEGVERFRKRPDARCGLV
jgi:hypothetical protein